MDIEIWKPIPSYETLYEISSNGVVKSLKTGAVRRPSNNGKYKQVTLTKNGIQKTYKVHRLVAITFIPNPDNLPCVNHKDEHPSNNNVNNLEWCTTKYNCNYGTRIKRMAKNHSKKVASFDKDGNLINVYDSIVDASKDRKCDTSSITKCCKGKRKICNGLAWKYV